MAPDAGPMSSCGGETLAPAGGLACRGPDRAGAAVARAGPAAQPRERRGDRPDPADGLGGRRGQGRAAAEPGGRGEHRAVLRLLLREAVRPVRRPQRRGRGDRGRHDRFDPGARRRDRPGVREGGGTGTGTAGEGRAPRRGGSRTATAGRAARGRADRLPPPDPRRGRRDAPPDRARPARRHPAAPGHPVAHAERHPRQGRRRRGRGERRAGRHARGDPGPVPRPGSLLTIGSMPAGRNDGKSAGKLGALGDRYGSGFKKGEP